MGADLGPGLRSSPDIHSEYLLLFMNVTQTIGSEGDIHELELDLLAQLSPGINLPRVSKAVFLTISVSRNVQAASGDDRSACCNGKHDSKA